MLPFHQSEWCTDVVEVVSICNMLSVVNIRNIVHFQDAKSCLFSLGGQRLKIDF